MTTDFNFGAKTTAAPAFGTGSITFGTPATQTQPAGGFQLGSTTPASSAPNLFGAGAGATFGSAAPAPSFGAPAGGGGLFGATSTAPTTGLSFGAPAATGAPSGAFSFGTTTTSAVPGLGFGAPTNTSAPTGGLTFGAPASSSTGLTFGAATTNAATGLTFGAPASSAPTPGLLFGAPTSSAPTTGLSFGLPAATSAAGGGLFGTPSSAPSGGLGAFGATTTGAGGLNFSLGGTPAATAATSAGLGGTNTLSFSLGNPGLSGVAQPKTAVTTVKEAPPKEQALPNEISQTVDHFKEFVKQQKLFSSDIARCSAKDYWKVDQEINSLYRTLTDVEAQLQRNRQLSEHLKHQTAGLLQNVEMAQRTHDTPAGLQYENTAPMKFFLDLADHFENEMQTIKMQIENADKNVKNFRHPDSITSQDLVLGMRRLHETFVALAGRLQSVHSQVESQKEMYMNLRRQLFNETSNPFPSDSVNQVSAANLKKALVYSPPKVATGPTPFSNMALGNLNPVMQQGSTPPAYGTTTSSSGQSYSTPLFGSTLGNQPSTSFFGAATTPLNQSTFQLQKPPSGTKRKV